MVPQVVAVLRLPVSTPSSTHVSAVGWVPPIRRNAEARAVVQYANAGKVLPLPSPTRPSAHGPVVPYCTVAPSDATSPSQRTRARRRYRLRALACRRARPDMRAWRVLRTEQRANRVGAQMRASKESHSMSGRCGANDGARRAPSLPVAASRGVPCQCRPTTRPQRGVASAWSAVWAARCMRSQVGEG